MYNIIILCQPDANLEHTKSVRRNKKILDQQIGTKKTIMKVVFLDLLNNKLK